MPLSFHFQITRKEKTEGWRSKTVSGNHGPDRSARLADNSECACDRSEWLYRHAVGDQ